jgi:predicted peptidase
MGRIASGVLAGMAFLWALSASARADDFAAFVYTDAAGKTLPYRLLKPENYDANVRYAIVIFLHGAGERGDDNQAQLKNGVGVFAKPANRKAFPCFVFAPQCPQKHAWSAVAGKLDPLTQGKNPTDPTRLALEAVDALMKEYSIDPDRQYITGLSLGGYGTWDLITRYPDRFAAAVPICGGGDYSKAALAVNVPIWAFHSADDPAVNVERSRTMIKVIRDAGGHPKYTEYNGLGHDSWDKAYAEPDLLPWIFAQRRGATK